MPATLVRLTSGWMQRKPQEDETADAGQRRFGVCLGGHAAADRLASREEWAPWDKARCQAEGGADGRLGERGRIRPPRASLHEGELIAQRGDPSLGKPGGEGREEGVSHAGARPMGERQAGDRLARSLQKSGDGPAVLEIDRQAFGIVTHAASTNRCFASPPWPWRERGGLLPATRVVEEETGERRAPIVEHAHERPARE